MAHQNQLNDLIQQLTQEHSNDVNKIFSQTNQEIFTEQNKNIFYCFVNIRTISHASTWRCHYNLYICNDNKTYQYIFEASFDQIKALQKKAYKKRNRCFPNKPFRAISTGVYRSQEFRKRRLMMQQYMTLPNKKIQSLPNNEQSTHISVGPKESWWSNARPLTDNMQNDKDALCFTLNRLFNTPLFALEDDLYKILQIEDNMKQIIQKLASDYIRKLKTKMRKSILDKCAEYKDKEQYKHLFKMNIKYLTFDSIYAVSVHQPKSNFTHWAIIYSGPDCSLKIDYCNDSKVHIQILHNYEESHNSNQRYLNIQSQRICWYSWKGQHTFNKRYDILVPISLQKRPIISNDIGCLIRVWLQNQYHQYNLAINNCQHFVRDMIAVHDIDSGRKLTDRFDKYYVAGAIVSASLTSMDIGDEYERMIRIRNYLQTELEQKQHTRLQTSIKLKQMLIDAQLQNYYQNMIFGGFYDGNLHKITSQDLLKIGINSAQNHEIFKFYQMQYVRNNSVLQFLKDCGLDKYYQSFYENGFDCNDDIYLFTDIKEKELKKEFGMKLGHYRKFKLNANKLIHNYNNIKIHMIVVGFIRHIIQEQTINMRLIHIKELQTLCMDYYHKIDRDNQQQNQNVNLQFNLYRFLQKYNLERYYTSFNDANIDDNDIETFASLQEFDLIDIKLKFGHRKRLLHYLKVDHWTV